MLLSLLLVFSQQMGYAHALTHAAASAELAAATDAAKAVAALIEDDSGVADWQNSAGPDAAHDADLSGITKLGFDHSCAQCLAVAQFTAAVDTRFHSFPLLDGVAVVAASAPLAMRTAGPVTAYLTRAPPVLSC
ncbi:hypothetical protein [Duganella qianjiadongensis]|uniref:Uncharacterized protein n=1 Tax=Duganella qianjiadongensis TaxID=2692176 RepID=A0ABW9VJN5_9BURK|nr:hypothetical protein [Duganella qianjiadongensis]MYM39537.1 hypothetical protein [Duganella qianjiadongensis]